MDELLKHYYDITFGDCPVLMINDNHYFDLLYDEIIQRIDFTRDLALNSELFDFFFRGNSSREKGKLNNRPSKNLQWDHFFYRTTKPPCDEHFCKVYISIKPKLYVKTIIKLMQYLDEFVDMYSSGGMGQWKFRTSPANDGVTIRFAKEEHYRGFVEFLEQNRDIIDSFDTPNAFMPQNEIGISVIPDSIGSYNYFVTKMIWDYMFFCKANKLEMTGAGLVDFINDYDCSKDKNLYENGDENINSFKTIMIGKVLGKPDYELLGYVFGEKNKKL